MENYVIKIKKGEEGQINQDNIYDEHLFFHDAYQRAAHCVEEILLDGEQHRKKQEKQSGGCREGKNTAIGDINRRLMGYPNNVIAFCAERGQGKTSAMTSFAEALSKMDNEDDIAETGEKRGGFWGSGSLGQSCCYEVLESIDPSMMEDGSSIIKMVLSGMFSRAEEQRRRYKRECLQGNDEDGDERYNSLLRQFQKCFRDLEVREQGKQQEDMDELEQIAELSDNANMRGTLYQLVERFLSYLDIGKKSYLVIQIDDADLNIRDAYRIVEDIRRYLVLPRVIILMAVNMRQMESVVQQHFITQYAESIRNSGAVTAESCRNIAELYLEKVIPSVRRIELPDVGQAIRQGKRGVTIYYCYKDEKEGNLLPKRNMEEQLLEMIHKRTGILFLPAKEYLHNLLPGSLRGLSQFLAYFSALPELSVDYWYLLQKPSQEILEQWRSNLNRLETYLLEAWAPVNLTSLGYDLLRSVQSSPDGNKHRCLLWALPEYYAKSRYEAAGGPNKSSKSITDYRREFESGCREYGLDIYRSNAYNHASFSDVYAALSVLVALPEGHRHYKLAYGVRVYYTIRLHQILLEQFLDRASEEEKWEVKQVKGRGLEEALQENREQRQEAVKEGTTRDEEMGDQINPLAVFLGDVLYKREGQLGKRTIGIPYGHYEVNVEELGKLLAREAKLNNASSENLPSGLQSRISQLCRWELRGYDYRTQAVSERLWEEMQDNPERKMVFNLFYPCLLALEKLRRTSEPSNELVSAMVLLLNCDVQYMLDHTLRHNEDYLRQDHGLLRQVFYNVWTYGLEKVVADIWQITKNDNYAKLFAWFGTYGKLSEGISAGIETGDMEICKMLFLLQMSISKLNPFAWKQLNKWKTRLDKLDTELSKEKEKLVRIEKPQKGKSGKKRVEKESAIIPLTEAEKGQKKISDLLREVSENGLEGGAAQKLYNAANVDLGIPELEYMVRLAGKETSEIALQPLTEIPLEEIRKKVGLYDEMWPSEEEGLYEDTDPRREEVWLSQLYPSTGE